jgi:hypothetical protein
MRRAGGSDQLAGNFRRPGCPRFDNLPRGRITVFPPEADYAARAVAALLSILLVVIRADRGSGDPRSFFGGSEIFSDPPRTSTTRAGSWTRA